ncbi:hypothetical protein ACP70R_017350 [Stipagrostis hirtigluma subsp. patula]
MVMAALQLHLMAMELACLHLRRPAVQAAGTAFAAAGAVVGALASRCAVVGAADFVLSDPDGFHFICWAEYTGKGSHIS